MSARVFKRGKSIVKTKRKIQAKTIVIVLAVILAILCAALIFAGNFLFNFALNPNASYTMNDLSAPVIKCKKTPRKKCSFVAERRKKR